VRPKSHVRQPSACYVMSWLTTVGERGGRFVASLAVSAGDACVYACTSSGSQQQQQQQHSAVARVLRVPMLGQPPALARHLRRTAGAVWPCDQVKYLFTCAAMAQA
jgi:hypothetical protein